MSETPREHWRMLFPQKDGVESFGPFSVLVGAPQTGV